MQKKYISLAVAALASGAAFAQTSVTFGGIVDMGFAYSSSHTTDGIKSQSAINSGGQDGSRLFWNAKEDLGNGLSVEAYQQLRFPADLRGGTLVADQSYLQLAGASWGALRAGTYGSVTDDINGFSETGGMGYGNGVLGMISRGTDYNVAGYVSPLIGGAFQAKFNVSTNNANATEGLGNGDLNTRSYGVNGTYVANGLKLGAAYQQYAKTLAAPKANEWMISGGYTMGQFSIGAGYDREKTDGVSVRKAYRINAGFAVTPMDQVALSYSRGKMDYDAAATTDTKAHGYGVSYSHMMSKRTNVYATYGKISQDAATAFVPATYESVLKVGVRHQF